MTITYHILGDAGDDNALYVRISRGQRVHRLLFDCGEGCAAHLPRAEVQQIDHLLFSHCHMDHIAGFDSFFRATFNRTARPNHVWGPDGTSAIVQHRMQGFCWNLTEDLEANWHVHDILEHQVVTTELRAPEAFATLHSIDQTLLATAIITTEDYRIESVRLDHRTPSIGYIVREPPRYNIDVTRLAERGLAAGPWLQDLVAPEGPATIDVAGQTFHRATLRAELGRQRVGGSIAYLTDFRLDDATLAALTNALRGVQTLVCESQYRAADAEYAARNYHVTAPQAATIAAQAGVENLVLFHLSERYRADERRALLAEAQTIFPAARLPVGWDEEKGPSGEH